MGTFHCIKAGLKCAINANEDISAINSFQLYCEDSLLQFCNLHEWHGSVLLQCNNAESLDCQPLQLCD